jgi:adenylate kinase family enzyme
MSGISRYIVLIGAPGVGKGTFAKIFSSQTEWKHLSVGDLLRKEVKNNTNLGKQVSSILSSGGLVSDTLVNSVTKKHLDNISQEYIYKDIYNASKNSTGRIDIDNAKIASKEIVQKYGHYV